MFDKDLCEKIISMLTEKSLSDLRKENDDSLYNELKELSIQVSEKLKVIDKDTAGVLIAYLDMKDLIADKECHYLYLQGAKDCISVMKTLSII